MNKECKFQIIDYIDKSIVTPESYIFTGIDRPWEIIIDISHLDTDFIYNNPPRMSKYLPLLPISPDNFISLNESMTRLVKSRTIGKKLNIDLYFKLENDNPTRSFKDRGSAVDISAAKQLGAKGIILASTGNMAASCACYASIAKLPCYVCVPDSIPGDKLSQILAYGAKVIKVRGSYDDAANLAYDIAKKHQLYLAGNYAFRIEGQKTAAFEIIDQMNFVSPDAIVVPMGCGTNIAAYGKGLREYLRLGIIDRMPKLIGVQAEGAQAIVNSYNRKTNMIKELSTVDTLATAIAVKKPNDGIKALDVIYETNGYADSVSDEEILTAKKMLATEEGLLIETSSATTLACLIKNIENKKSLQNQIVVCVLTGDGLKDLSTVKNNFHQTVESTEINERMFDIR